MKIAAIYDIHANLPALQAVLDDIEQCNVDLVIVGGDVIAGPMPSATLAALQNFARPMQFILGNAEAELLRCVAGAPINGLTERADAEARWQASVLSTPEIDFIASWANIISLHVAGLGEVLFCHATPHSNIEIFTTQSDAARLRQLFQPLTADYVICGHTHMPFQRTLDDLQIINAGSVGMPFGKTGADWLLIDAAPQLRHTDYDLNAAARVISASNYPEATEFATNNVLQSPSQAQALTFLSHFETIQINAS